MVAVNRVRAPVAWRHANSRNTTDVGRLKRDRAVGPTLASSPDSGAARPELHTTCSLVVADSDAAMLVPGRNSLMTKPSSHILDLVRRGAALSLRALVNDVNLLIQSFPDLRDAFDPDDLPLPFIMKRDSRSGETTFCGRPKPVPVAVRKAVNRRGRTYWPERHPGQR